jgi:hypothetical protein
MSATAEQEAATNRTINLDDLQGEAEKLVSLLKDRQPGLTTWHMFLHERIASLRDLLNGAFPEVKKLVLKARFSLLVGGKSVRELVKMVKSVGELGSYAESMMNNKDFKPAAKAEQVDFVVLTPKDFGFTESPRTDVLFDPKRLAKWSEDNLDGQVVELCHTEDGPHLRAHYKDQPNGEVLWIGMERVTGSGGIPRVFRVERGYYGSRWLSSYWTEPGVRWNLDSEFVFRIRKSK